MPDTEHLTSHGPAQKMSPGGREPLGGSQDETESPKPRRCPGFLVPLGAILKAADWLSAGVGVFSLGLLLWIRHWWAAGAVALVLGMQLSVFWRRLPRPPGSDS